MEKVTAVIFGHHKCATRYITRIARRFCRALELSYIEVNIPRSFRCDLLALVKVEKPDFLNYMNAEPRYANTLLDCFAFHVVRDARDLAISAYYSHFNSHETKEWPELAPHRAKLAELDFEEGLMLDLEFTDRLPTDGHDISVFRALDEWNYHQPNTLELKFEEVVTRPSRTLLAAFEFIGLLRDERSRRQEILLAEIESNTFLRLSGGREPGEEDAQHHYRRGIPGDWRRYFSQRHKAWFKEHYPELLIKNRI